LKESGSRKIIAENWRSGLVFILPKKGKVLNCLTWRGMPPLYVIKNIVSNHTRKNKQWNRNKTNERTSRL
jgi:hypothetical protein